MAWLGPAHASRARTCRRLAGRALRRAAALAARLLRGGRGGCLPRPLLLHRHAQRQGLRGGATGGHARCQQLMMGKLSLWCARDNTGTLCTERRRVPQCAAMGHAVPGCPPFSGGQPGPALPLPARTHQLRIQGGVHPKLPIVKAVHNVACGGGGPRATRLGGWQRGCSGRGHVAAAAGHDATPAAGLKARLLAHARARHGASCQPAPASTPAAAHCAARRRRPPPLRRRRRPPPPP